MIEKFKSKSLALSTSLIIPIIPAIALLIYLNNKIWTSYNYYVDCIPIIFLKVQSMIHRFLLFTANGRLCPPCVVYPYIKPPRAIAENVLKDWIFGKSAKGFM